MAKILLADDDADLLAAFGRLIRRAGHRLTSTDNGGDVLARLRDLRRQDGVYDLIILDMKMPVMSGWDVLEELKAIPAPPPVIVMTGSREAAERLRDAIREGRVARVFHKPTPWEEMLAGVNEVLARPPAPEVKP